MIVFGPIQAFPLYFKEPLLLYNLSSYREGLNRLYLSPDINSVRPYIFDQKQFDILYANMIMSDDNYFYEFMQKLIYPMYSGLSVYVAVTRSDVFDIVTESLIKLIQQRYGYTPYLINEPEDLEYVDTSVLLSTQGVLTLDMDKEKYSYLYAKRNANHIDQFGNLDGRQEFI